MTDWLPFSFWVRPYFMEPVYRMAKAANVDNEGAASAAVLSGHFMIWAGPATTMCQRKFVPDWSTCAIIQPLGLMEDVGVVLAAWAGKSATSAKQAEIGLYIFMATMNFLNWATRAERKKTGDLSAPDAPHPRLTQEAVQHTEQERQSMKIHGIVFVLTMIAMAVCIATPVPDTTNTTTSAPPEACAATHENLSTMIKLGVKVFIIAVVARVIARIMVVSQWFQLPPRPAGGVGGAQEPLLEQN